MEKYLKYKLKYLKLIGGASDTSSTTSSSGTGHVAFLLGLFLRSNEEIPMSDTALLEPYVVENYSSHKYLMIKFIERFSDDTEETWFLMYRINDLKISIGIVGSRGINNMIHKVYRVSNEDVEKCFDLIIYKNLLHLQDLEEQQVVTQNRLDILGKFMELLDSNPNNA